MKTVFAIIGFLAGLMLLAYALAAPTTNCYDPGAAAEFPHVRCSGGFLSTASRLLDADAVAQCITIPAAEVDYTLPAHNAFEFCAHGTEAFVLCAAAAPVAATTVVGGYSFRVADGQCIGPYEFTGFTVCSVIGTVSPAGNALCIHGLDY